MRFLLAAILPSLATAIVKSVAEEQIDHERNWFSLSPETDFQPAEVQDPRLRSAQRRYLEYTDKFIDGNTYYDDYSQAWRMLGWYIDCTASSDHRRLQEGEDDGDGGNNANVYTYCQRYILWAAYVDLDYQGGGIGEYQFFNASSGTWDNSACELRDSLRCVKMDCHDPGTHFKLLGFFKQYDYDDFMEQLFKHQAYCIWTAEQYSFMGTYRDWWPQGCTETGQSSGSNSLYMDIKPQRGGSMDLGLYTDSYCTTPYTGSGVSMSSLVNGYYGNSLDEHIAMWNEAFDVFHYCQPCKAYALWNTGGGGGDDDSNGGYFQCDDDAGYTNVNQCMKFATQTNMAVASFQDVALASRQGAIARSWVSDVRPSFFAEWGLLIIACVVFVLGVFAFLYAARPPRVVRSSSVRTPLVGK